VGGKGRRCHNSEGAQLEIMTGVKPKDAGLKLLGVWSIHVVAL